MFPVIDEEHCYFASSLLSTTASVGNTRLGSLTIHRYLSRRQNHYYVREENTA